ncbi:S41 family peptidase [Flavihumibacter fluvii]|uniref:S41 family peptidase n=1 Tax=Flavihumibacter fluvii TaxID=2838157 RepID=UPI001BDDD3E4|nr:S41 family peptidase [Flavihumibacter fluvii]ULQ54700.1 S41 family peptidase [Flavihumibacter fluvii]
MSCKQLMVGLFFSCIPFSGLEAQVPDSLKHYVYACLEVMQKESLYASQLNWNNIRDSVNQQLGMAKTLKEAESSVIWVFAQLKDHHGMYGGIDTTYRYQKPGPEREFSKGILAEYQKPRSIRIRMLANGIAYYKMPAVLIGSNQEKMKQWANMLTDSLCKLETQHPRGYIVDLRMNNGGNSEPMWQALKDLIGEENHTYTADANRKILPDETDSVTVRYRMAALPDRPCSFQKHIPVAVLIGPGTASSGEIMALSFSTRRKTRLFGEPTIGVASVTNGFVIQEKGYLLLTVGYIANARKEILSSYYIQPDVFVKSDDNYSEPEKDVTVQAALKWLNQ